jgi:hypothetical protein
MEIINMQHIERSAFRKGEYTALAGTAATLTRYRIYREHGVWYASPRGTNSMARDLTRPSLMFARLRDMDIHFVEMSR